MTSRYFGGEGESLGLVAPLGISSFSDLAKEVFAHPVQLPRTRAAFFALPEKDKTAPMDQNRAKRCRFLTPATFEGTTRRTEFARECNLVFLDVDDSDQAKHVLGLKLVNALAPYSFAVYHTARSTADAPRLRVVVAAEKLPVGSYSAALGHIAKLLGLDFVTPESDRVVQPMFLPVSFRGDEPEEHPLVIAHLDGREMTVADIAPDGAAPKEPAQAGDVLLEHLRPRIEEISVEDAVSALERLDPDCDRHRWIELGAALKHQFGDEGLDIWTAWSAKGTKFPGDEAVGQQWRSMRQTPRGRAPVTIRTLLKLATEAGWTNQKVLQKCFVSTERWLKSGERTATELLREAVQRIVATPMLTPLETGALLSLCQARLGELGVKVGRADLTKQLKQATSQLKGKGGDSDDEPDSPSLPEWLRGICYVGATDEFFRPGTGQKWAVAPFNNTFSRFLMTQSEEDQAQARPQMLPQHFALNSVRIKTVDDYLYDPTRPQDNFPIYANRKFVNVYRSDYPEPDEQGLAEVRRLIHTHCSLLFHREDEGRTVLDWIAHIVQNPGGKSLWALVLQGCEGSGKSWFFEAIRTVLGASNVKEVQAHAVMHSSWTEREATTQAVSIPEIRVVGENRHLVMNKLKSLIADKVIPIEQRNRDTRSVPNFANYFLTTNHTDALALTGNDRRYYVLFTKIQSKAEVRAIQATGHYQRLFAILREFPGALRKFFLDWKISESFDPILSPESAYKAEMLEAAASPLQRAVELAIADEDNPLVRSDLVSFTVLRQVLEATNSGLGRFTDQALAAVLRDLGYVNRVRLRIGDDRHTLWCPKNGYDAEQATNFAKLRIAGEDIL